MLDPSPRDICPYSDVLPLIERGRQYHTAHCGARPEPWHHPVVPALRPHKSLLLRAVILIRKKTNNRVHVLVSEKTAAHLPVCQINPMRSIHSTLKKFLTEIFGAEIPSHKVGPRAAGPRHPLIIWFGDFGDYFKYQVA